MQSAMKSIQSTMQSMQPSMSTTFQIQYFEAAALADMPRMMLECAGAKYENVFVDRKDWPAMKESMTFGKMPKLIVRGMDGEKVPYPVFRPSRL